MTIHFTLNKNDQIEIKYGHHNTKACHMLTVQETSQIITKQSNGTYDINLKRLAELT